MPKLRNCLHTLTAFMALYLTGCANLSSPRDPFTAKSNESADGFGGTTKESAPSLLVFLGVCLAPFQVVHDTWEQYWP